MSLKGSKVLVVGGAGFVGSNLVEHLLDQDVARVQIVDNMLSSDVRNVSTDDRVELIEGSVADDAVLRLIEPNIDFAWHLACYHGNQSSIHDPVADHDNNLLTSLKLFNHLKDLPKLTKVVYAAAGCAVAEKTFGEARATTEEDPISLFHDSPYSISKIVGEMYGNYFWGRYGLPLVKTRFQNVYGPREILGAGQWRGTPHTVWRNVTPTFIWKALHHIALPLENAGQTSRDFIYVGDMARGLALAAEHGTPGEVYNLASGVETSIAELAHVINDITQNPTAPQQLPARDWDRSGRRFGSTEKSRRVLGFEAQVSLRQGIELTVEWTRANKELIESCILQHDRHMQDLSLGG